MSQHKPKDPDELKELVFVLRRMMYMFIRWAEKKYGWASQE